MNKKKAWSCYSKEEHIYIKNQKLSIKYDSNCIWTLLKWYFNQKSYFFKIWGYVKWYLCSGLIEKKSIVKINYWPFKNLIFVHLCEYILFYVVNICVEMFWFIKWWLKWLLNVSKWSLKWLSGPLKTWMLLSRSRNETSDSIR